jgi:hypothetical protein
LLVTYWKYPLSWGKRKSNGDKKRVTRNEKLATSNQKRVTSNPSLFLEVLEIGFPFHGEEVILFVVTFFTNGGHVSLGCLASPNQGNDVIHGELRRGKLPGAIGTNAPGQLLLPPPGLA